VTGSAESWPDDEVWRRLEQALALVQASGLPGGSLDDEAALERAAAEAQARISAEPADFAAHRMLAVVSALLGRTTEAVDAMRTALCLDPDAG
jgi:cytochrome c-type biogenesis protein CcmH/NrfG